MKYKITIYVLVVISLISLLSHYLIYEKFTKYLLHDAGDLSRINYDLSYRSQIRNKIIDKNKYFFFKEGEKNNSFVTTMGDSFLNCKNEKTCIQNYFSIEHYPVTHFSLRPDKYSFPQVLDSTLDYLNSEYFILESVERGLVPTYGSRLFSLNDIQSESIQQDNNRGEKTKIEFFKFLNTANFKFIFRKLLDLSSFRSDNFFVNQVQSMFFGKAVKKKLNRDFFSVNPNQLYFSNDDYKSKFVSDSQMSTIVQNFVYLNKKQDSNKEIDKFFEMKISDLTINRLSDLTLEFVNSKTLLDFQNCIKKHENIISETLKTTPVKNKYFNDYKGEIKSLGAWGGDFILAAGPINSKKYFYEKGYKTVFNFKEIF